MRGLAIASLLVMSGGFGCGGSSYDPSYRLPVDSPLVAFEAPEASELDATSVEPAKVEATAAEEAGKE